MGHRRGIHESVGDHHNFPAQASREAISDPELLKLI
jgi:hypothetical protein